MISFDCLCFEKLQTLICLKSEIKEYSYNLPQSMGQRYFILAIRELPLFII